MLLLSYALQVLLFGGAFAVSLYSDAITDTYKAVILGASLVASAVLYYFQGYQPALSASRRRDEQIVEALLRALEHTYREENPGTYNLRINVMRVRRRHLFGSIGMRIHQSRGGYKSSELEQVYAPNQGCAGIAYSQRIQCLYDAREIPAPVETLTYTQRDITSEVRSILSTPLFRPDDLGRLRPVAILNLDSTDAIDKCAFQEKANQALVEAFGNSMLAGFF